MAGSRQRTTAPEVLPTAARPDAVVSGGRVRWLRRSVLLGSAVTGVWFAAGFAHSATAQAAESAQSVQSAQSAPGSSLLGRSTGVTAPAVAVSAVLRSPAGAAVQSAGSQAGAVVRGVSAHAHRTGAVAPVPVVVVLGVLTPVAHRVTSTVAPVAHPVLAVVAPVTDPVLAVVAPVHSPHPLQPAPMHTGSIVPAGVTARPGNTVPAIMAPATSTVPAKITHGENAPGRPLRPALVAPVRAIAATIAQTPTTSSTRPAETAGAVARAHQPRAAATVGEPQLPLPAPAAPQPLCPGAGSVANGSSQAQCAVIAAAQPALSRAQYPSTLVAEHTPAPRERASAPSASPD